VGASTRATEEFFHFVVESTCNREANQFLIVRLDICAMGMWALLELHINRHNLKHGESDLKIDHHVVHPQRFWVFGYVQPCGLLVAHHTS
jgi:hypothetical protein